MPGARGPPEMHTVQQSPQMTNCFADQRVMERRLRKAQAGAVVLYSVRQTVPDTNLIAGLPLFKSSSSGVFAGGEGAEPFVWQDWANFTNMCPAPVLVGFQPYRQIVGSGQAGEHLPNIKSTAAQFGGGTPCILTGPDSCQASDLLMWGEPDPAREGSFCVNKDALNGICPRNFIPGTLRVARSVDWRTPETMGNSDLRPKVELVNEYYTAVGERRSVAAAKAEQLVSLMNLSGRLGFMARDFQDPSNLANVGQELVTTVNWLYSSRILGPVDRNARPGVWVSVAMGI